MSSTLILGDNRWTMRRLPDASVDAVVCDPPYGLGKEPDMAEVLEHWLAGDDFEAAGGGFMGKTWDSFVPGPATWREVLRVLKPGGHLLAFAGARTLDVMGLAIRLAGFEIRDCLSWLYGSGFPKSLDVSKAIDKLDATDERRARALRFTAWMREHLTAGQIDAATSTNMGGHYTSLKAQPAIATADLFDKLRHLLPEVPADIEQIVAERTVESLKFASREVVGSRSGTTIEFAPGEYLERPAVDVAVTAPATADAARWQGWGTALKPAWEPIIMARKPLIGTVAANVLAHGAGAINVDGCRIGTEERFNPAAGNKPGGASLMMSQVGMPSDAEGRDVAGRWPANVALDEAAAEALDEQSGTLVSNGGKGAHRVRSTAAANDNRVAYGDYAPTESQVYGDSGGASRFFYVAKPSKSERNAGVEAGNVHPTVKPIALMAWLCRLVTPPGGLVLDPFVGSGTTGIAAAQEGFRFIGLEREAEYLTIAEARIRHHAPEGTALTVLDFNTNAA